jgi:transcriptional regulator with XRE-family HTH domain
MDLRVARAIRRQRQWDLRKETGIHQSKISLIEHGYVIPTDEERVAIAGALGVSVNEIDWPEETLHQCQEASR